MAKKKRENRQVSATPEWTGWGRIALGLSILNAVWIFYLIFWHLNWVQVDLAGHMASAQATARGLYHRYQPQLFLGMIHGLFYPPLEDWILAALGRLATLGSTLQNLDRWVVAYQVYLVALSWTWLGVLLKFLWGRTQSGAMRLVGTFSLLLFLNLDKPGLLQWQGLGFFDLLVTGLSAQVLSGIFVVLWLDRWLKILSDREECPRWDSKLACYSAGAIFSHLVMGMVLGVLQFAWVFVLALSAIKAGFGKKILSTQRLKLLLVQGLFALALTAVFWLPFVASGVHLISSKVLLSNVVTTWLFSLQARSFWIGAQLVLLGFFLWEIWKKREAASVYIASLPILVIGLFLLLANEIPHAWKEVGEAIPRFHYYRLIAPGILLGILSLFSTGRRHGFWISLVLCLVSLKPYSYPLDRNSHQRPELGEDFQKLIETSESQGRVWMLGNYRPIDFGLDSAAMILNPGFRSNKGLYWESSRQNLATTAYFGPLVGPPSVIDYAALSPIAGETFLCLFEHMVVDHSLDYLVLDRKRVAGYAAEDIRTSWEQLLNGQLPAQNFLLRRMEGLKFTFSGGEFEIFRVHPIRAGSEAARSMAVRIDPSRVQVARWSEANPSQVSLIVKRLQECQDHPGKFPGHSEVYAEEVESPAFLEFESARSSALQLRRAGQKFLPEDEVTSQGISFRFSQESPSIFSGTQKIAEVRNELGTPTWVALKLTKYQGVEAIHESGMKQAFLDAFPHPLVRLEPGTTTLVYEQSVSMWVGAALSLVSLLLMAWAICCRK
jgi:hypothetical protein